MKLIKQSWGWMQKPPANAMELIENAGRVCYRSGDKITDDSSEKFVKMILNNGHFSCIEHINASINLITNRGVTHELVRHRLCSFSQESTRYVNYRGVMEFIKPVWWDEFNESQRGDFEASLKTSETYYNSLIKSGARPEQAREVLPNALKTEIVMTCNIREWLHVFNLRCSKKAHPQIRGLMKEVLKGFYDELPIIFDELYRKYILESS